MSSNKLLFSALTLVGTSLFSRCQADPPSSNDWTSNGTQAISVFKRIKGNGTATYVKTSGIVTASASAVDSEGYVATTYQINFVYTPNGGPNAYGPATLQTTETASISGTASGEGYGFSNSSIAGLDYFCPSNYALSGDEYDTYSLDSTHDTVSITFSLHASATLPTASSPSATRARMLRGLVCHRPQASPGSVSTSAEATIALGGS